jgi:hypothetical protein
VTAGTIFQDTRTPLPVWFRAMWWVTTQKNGASGLGLQRVLGLKKYETAWTWLHKFRRAMVRPGRDVAQQRVEVVGASALAAVGDFLAPDAERRPWHRRQTLGADVLFTLDTYAEVTLRDEAQRSADVPQQIGVAVQITDHQLALGGVLHFIESIGALFDGDAVAIA